LSEFCFDAGRHRALLLDRDGTLNVDRGWVHRPEDFCWTEDAREAIRWANDRGILVPVITNQSGIARGYYTEEEFWAFTGWIDRQLAERGAHIDGTYYCPHHPSEGLGAYHRECRCRKPGPALIERALEEWKADPAQTVLVGNSRSDMDAAEAAGIRGVRFAGGSLLDCVRRAFA